MIKGDVMTGNDMTRQRGGTFLGFIVGLVVGLGLALVVAVYVTKVPVPFVNKLGNHTPEKDASEVQKNKDWDPNTPLYGKNPAKPAAPAEVALPAPSTAEKSATPAVSAEGVPSEGVAVKQEAKPAKVADPLGDLVKARAAAKDGVAASAEPFNYFVQVGAFRSPEDAESQRAKLSLAGIETKVSEREQAGRTVYRVRTGPFDKREDADKSKARLDTLGIETALVRVQR